MNSAQVQISVRVPSDTAYRLDDMSRSTGQSRSSIIRWVLSGAKIESLPKGWIDAAEETKEARRVEVVR